MVITALHRYYFSECLRFRSSSFICFSFVIYIYVYLMTLSPSCDLGQASIAQANSRRVLRGLLEERQMCLSILDPACLLVSGE